MKFPKEFLYVKGDLQDPRGRANNVNLKLLFALRKVFFFILFSFNVYYFFFFENERESGRGRERGRGRWRQRWRRRQNPK